LAPVTESPALRAANSLLTLLAHRYRVLGVEGVAASPLSRAVLAIVAPRRVMLEGVEGDDRDALAVFGCEGLKVHEAWHGPDAVLHSRGQLAIAIGLCIRSQSGAEYGDDRTADIRVHSVPFGHPDDRAGVRGAGAITYSGPFDSPHLVAVA
jgi:hypothetical protein